MIETGLFEQAHGGTLYLDEIASFPQRQQKAILKMLLDGGITRMGGSQLVSIDARIYRLAVASREIHFRRSFCVKTYFTG